MLHLCALSSILFSILVLATATPLRTRRDIPQQLALYIQDVRTAIYAVSIIQGGNASTVCSNPDTTDVLETQGLNVTYAETLICESAIGIGVFPNTTEAAADLGLALTGLEAAENSSATLADLQCPHNNTSTLDDAGLDGEAIWSIICSSGSQTSAVSAPSSISMASTNAGVTATVTALDGPPPGSISTSSANATNITSTLAFSSISIGASSTIAPTSSSTVTNGSSSAATNGPAISSAGSSESTVTVFQTVWIDDPPLSVSFPSSTSANTTTTVNITSTRLVFTTVTETPDVMPNSTSITHLRHSHSSGQQSHRLEPATSHWDPNIHPKPSSAWLASWTVAKSSSAGNATLGLGSTRETGCI